MINKLTNLEKNKIKIQKYKRPKITITDLMQKNNEILKQLKNFIEINLDDLYDLPKFTYLKYLTYCKKSNKELFRFGGKLICVKDNYIVLKGRKCTFCVQKYIFNNNNQIIYKTRFFNKHDANLESKSLKYKLNDTIDKANNMYVKQTMQINEQKEKIKNLKKKVIKLKNINSLLITKNN